MLKSSKGRIEFYADIRIAFPFFSEDIVWSENDYNEDPTVSAEIMTSLAEKLVSCYKLKDYSTIENVLSFLESGYYNYSDEIMCYVYTDFLPTVITTSNREAREFIKSKFGRNLIEHYNQLINLGFYTEEN